MQTLYEKCSIFHADTCTLTGLNSSIGSSGAVVTYHNAFSTISLLVKIYSHCFKVLRLLI